MRISIVTNGRVRSVVNVPAVRREEAAAVAAVLAVLGAAVAADRRDTEVSLLGDAAVA